MNADEVPGQPETHVLLTSRRRCFICFGLRRDTSIKRGQIAHLDADPSNNKPENLCFLCLDHHDEYDGRTSQSKGLTIHEVKYYRTELYKFLRSEIRASREPFGESPWSDLWPAGNWTAEHDEALEFHSGTHRSQSVVLSVATGPKNAQKINSGIPPHDLSWTTVIIRDVIERGWIQPTSGEPLRYELSRQGRRMLCALEEIPESIKYAAWRRIWFPERAQSS